MKLSDILWDDLKIGMKVISARKIPGKITMLRDTQDRFPSIWITWENGNESGVFHHQAEYITVLADES